jgi:hypothetical protein
VSLERSFLYLNHAIYYRASQMPLLHCGYLFDITSRLPPIARMWLWAIGLWNILALQSAICLLPTLSFRFLQAKSTAIARGLLRDRCFELEQIKCILLSIRSIEEASDRQSRPGPFWVTPHQSVIIPRCDNFNGLPEIGQLTAKSSIAAWKLTIYQNLSLQGLLEAASKYI